MSTFNGTAYHHGDLRRALLDAATAVLSRDGVGAVTLREVARLAGVSHNAPYRHFPSRDALLAGVAAQGFGRLRERLEGAGDDLKAMGEAYLAFAIAERPCFLLMFGGGLCRSHFPELASAAKAALLALDRVASAGHAVSEDPPDPSGVGPATLRAWAIVHGFAHLVADGQLSAEAASQALAADGRSSAIATTVA